MATEDTPSWAPVESTVLGRQGTDVLNTPEPNATAVDLFAGAGGATQGLRDAGFDVIGAVEFDSTAAESYRLNHPSVRLWETDIRRIPATSIARELSLEPGQLTLLKACPPCQGFSTLAGKHKNGDDPRNELVGHTVRFVRALRPKGVLLENVPGLGRDRRSSELLDELRKLGYAARLYQVNATQFGVPQRRKRIIILGLRGLRSNLPAELTELELDTPVTVRKAFEELQEKGLCGDPLNVVQTPKDAILERIKAVPIGGNRFDLPDHLQLDCHKRLTARGLKSAGGSYGRMLWDAPSPTMTTRCTTPACGSFIHPEEDRAITLREAAALQTFPHDYKFAGSRGDIERQIGNAVPVKMAAAIGKSVLRALRHPSN